MRTPLLSIVVPVYNQWDITRRCLESFAANGAGVRAELLVVDNGSTDATPEHCPGLGAALFGDCFRYLNPGRNLNFGPGCNLGARESSGELIFFLNNDTVAAPGWAEPLLTEMSSGAGAAGPLLLFPASERVQHLGISFHPDFKAGHLHSHLPGDHALAGKRRLLQAITGAALMVPRALFEEIGGFHEGYANGCEDIELCARLRQKGRELVCSPRSLIYHEAGVSQGRYDREAANYRLLRERCPDCFEPDFHRHAAADGYELRLAENLDEYMAVPEARSREHIQRVGDFDEVLCRELLAREVYWEEGYELLASRLESAGALEEALPVRYDQSLFTPTRRALARLMVLCDRLGLAEAADAARQGVEDMGRRAADAEGMLETAAARAAFYREAGEERLAGLYEGRAAEHRGE